MRVSELVTRFCQMAVRVFVYSSSSDASHRGWVGVAPAVELVVPIMQWLHQLFMGCFTMI